MEKLYCIVDIAKGKSAKKVREGFTKKSSCSFGFCPNYLEPTPLPLPSKTSIKVAFKITHYPKFFLNKARILTL